MFVPLSPTLPRARYEEVLVGMMDSVLRKLQLHHNIDELREIDDDAVDDDVRPCTRSELTRLTQNFA